MLEERTYEGDKVGHGSSKDTEDTGKKEGRVPCNSSTVLVNKVLHAEKWTYPTISQDIPQKVAPKIRPQ